MLRHTPPRPATAQIILAACAAIAIGCADRPAADARDTGAGATGSASSGDSAAQADRQGTEPADEAALTFPADSGTIGVTARERPRIEPVILRAIRTATHDAFDRVVFVFDTAGLPGYQVEYVDRPMHCGSGDPVDATAGAWLHVRMWPARAHEWRDDTLAVATITERSRQLSLPTLRHLVLTCDFEAQLEAVLGVGGRSRYRVMELSDPARLVIDIRR